MIWLKRLADPYIIWGLVVACVLSSSATWTIKSRLDDRAKLKAIERVVKVERKSAEVTTKVDLKHTAEQAKVRTVTKTILKEVPVYVTRKADTECSIPAGFVSVFNASANGEVPQTSSGADESAASGVVLSEVAQAIVENHGTYHEVASQMKALQEWVAEQGKVYGTD